MFRLPRFIPALVLVILYATIVVSPLAPLAMRTELVAQILIGECAGECSLCGCSTERSANHTCCCWQKKLLAGHDDEHYEDHGDDQDQADCCKKNQTGTKNILTTISSRPCSSGKTAALLGVEHGDVFPYALGTTDPVVSEATLTARSPDCTIDWPGEPPDHPPQISFLAT
ncbi:MAG TPA: hypothetical protein HPP94_00565 [Desulfuromonadales bacterium]|nr:hypothetical protein [Desulfuromonadales bacterium]